jgi:hypothetical protein
LYYLVSKFAAIPAKKQNLQTAESKERNERYLLNNAVVVSILQCKTITLQECKKNKKDGGDHAYQLDPPLISALNLLQETIRVGLHEAS